METSRRAFLAGAAGLGLAGVGLSMGSDPVAEPDEVLRPPALRPGDRIAIVCPAGPADDQAHLDRAAERVRSLGFEPVLGKRALARWGYLAGTDAERAEDLNEVIRDPDVQGVFCLRGGYGAIRILPVLDYEAMRKSPKVIMGYSDITALHLAYLAQSGVVSFHGPCAESSWTEYARGTLPVCLAAEAWGEVKNAASTEPRRTLVPGVAEGPLVGGNLTLVASMCGTPYLPSLAGAIVFLEDIGEEPYRVDRMLTQLILNGGLAEAAGIVFGNFRKRPRPGEEPPPDDPTLTFSMEQVHEERAKAAGVPAMAGLPFGHVADNHIMPLGVRARLDATAQTLTLLEPAVR
ncbi:MAG: LD-carboxypeptidase [Armatimonadota bacterium]